MDLVSAHDLRTGAAFVLPANARCVKATAALHAEEVDQAIPNASIDPSEVRPLGSCEAGSIVYVEWQAPRGDRWIKLRVLRSPTSPT